MRQMLRFVPGVLATKMFLFGYKHRLRGTASKAVQTQLKVCSSTGLWDLPCVRTLTQKSEENRFSNNKKLAHEEQSENF